MWNHMPQVSVSKKQAHHFGSGCTQTFFLKPAHVSESFGTNGLFQANTWRANSTLHLHTFFSGVAIKYFDVGHDNIFLVMVCYMKLKILFQQYIYIYSGLWHAAAQILPYHGHHPFWDSTFFQPWSQNLCRLGLWPFSGQLIASQQWSDPFAH